MPGYPRLRRRALFCRRKDNELEKAAVSSDFEYFARLTAGEEALQQAQEHAIAWLPIEQNTVFLVGQYSLHQKTGGIFRQIAENIVCSPDEFGILNGRFIACSEHVGHNHAGIHLAHQDLGIAKFLRYCSGKIIDAAFAGPIDGHSVPLHAIAPKPAEVINRAMPLFEHAVNGDVAGQHQAEQIRLNNILDAFRRLVPEAMCAVRLTGIVNPYVDAAEFSRRRIPELLNFGKCHARRRRRR